MSDVKDKMWRERVTYIVETPASIADANVSTMRE